MTEFAEQLDKIFEAHKGQEGALLPILHDIQAEFGVVSEDMIPQIAKALNLSRAEVYGVVTFYHDFRRNPAGKHVVKLCRAEACRSVGAAKLEREILDAFGLQDFGTTADGNVTIEAVYCLGLCPLSPAALVDGEPMARASVEKVKGAVA